MAENNVQLLDNIPMLADVNVKPSIFLDIKLSYLDSKLDKIVRVMRNMVYKIIYLEKGRLCTVVGEVKDISRIFTTVTVNEDRKSYNEYVLTIDCSNKYNTNVKKIRTGDIRSIRKFIDHMDEETDIPNAITLDGNTVASKITNVVINNIRVENTVAITINENGTGIAEYQTDSFKHIVGGTIEGGKTDPTTVTNNGVASGINTSGNHINVADGVTSGEGDITAGNIITAMISFPHFDSYDTTEDPEDVKCRTIYGAIHVISEDNKWHGDIENVIISHTKITGSSTGGNVVDVIRDNTIVYGGTISGENMKTTNGITYNDTTTDGVTTDGVIKGGYVVTIIDGGRTCYLYGDDLVTTGAIANNCVITGGTVSGGTNGIYPGGAGGKGFNVTINGTVVGGVGTNGVAFGGHTEGGVISFECKFNPMDYRIVTPYTASDNTPDTIIPPMPWRYDNTLFKVGVGDVTGVITNFHTATNL